MATTTISNIRGTAIKSEIVSGKKLLWAAPLTGAIAAVLNAIVYFLYTANGFNIILPLPSPTEPTPLALAVVVIFTFLPALAAGGLLWALNKFTQRPLTNFTIIAVIALILSFGMSVALDMPVAFKIGLDVMHVVAAVVIIGGLTRFAREA